MVTHEDVLHTLEGADVSTPVADLKLDIPLISQGLDSLDMATVMLALEAKYNKAIRPEQASRLRTVADIVTFLNS
ncbi:acyl carrier protein [Polyangium spumosum]|uniref:Carrier domain-containing protein n=1 Tax=Polyangium spumosum TaxID=889282 RepID=A0A6N7Q006_9BACT|nr:acyl carrier protein [Polyangium spumosum]MRG97802.1 hypothetical protein [Polyangium spumosum]